MSNKNDITGDTIISKTSNQAYDDGYDRIFGKPKCLECGGTGYVDYPILWGGGVVDYTCPECNGTGERK